MDAVTSRKSSFPDARHAVTNSDGGQARAASESVSFDARRTVTNNNGGKASANSESRRTDTRHVVGEGDGGQACAAIVFVNAFISIICALNDRKVKMWIL